MLQINNLLIMINICDPKLQSASASPETYLAYKSYYRNLMITIREFSGTTPVKNYDRLQ